MENSLITITDFKGEGYQPLVSYGTWRVAVLNYLDELLPSNIKTMERHMDTDEVFILTQGKAMLLLGGNTKAIDELSSFKMEIGGIYNLKKETWHSVILSQDAHIVIVENDNTCTENSEYASLSDEQQASLQARAKAFLA